MSYSNSVEVVGEGGVDEMLLETMGPKYFSGKAEAKAAVEPVKIEEPKKEEVKEEEKEKEEQPKEEEGEKKETDDAADGEKVRVSDMNSITIHKIHPHGTSTWKKSKKQT